MANIIRDVGLGEKLGTGISDSLQSLATNRLGRIQQREMGQRTARGLEALNFNPEEASALSNLDPQILQNVVKQRLAAPNEANYLQALQSLLGGNQQTAQMPNQQGLPEQQMLAGQQQTPQGINSQSGLRLAQGGINSQQATKLAELGLKQQENTKREEHQAKRLALEEKKLAEAAKKELTKEQRIEQHHIDKETEPIYKEIVKGAKVAKENDEKLARIKKIAQTGNLGSPIANSALKAITKGIFGFGLDVTSFMTADAQELQKISDSFINGAKEVFGGSLTDADLAAYLKQLPSLSQSRAGMLRIIDNMQVANETQKLRKNALDEILLENNGLRPRNLESEIEKRVGPQLEELAKKFVNAPQEKNAGFLSGALYY